MWLKEGNVHDLTALKEMSDELPGGINLFGDKAYADEHFKTELKEHQIQLFTPIKKPKKKSSAMNKNDLTKQFPGFGSQSKVSSNG